MRQALISILFCLLLTSCYIVETATNKDIQINNNRATSDVPDKFIQNILSKPVFPSVKLNQSEQKELNKSLPPQVRRILEKSEKFEVLAEVHQEGDNEPDYMDFQPNRIAAINDEAKKEILENFYYDASAGESNAICYDPHHEIRASYKGKTVEIEICFNCGKFFVESPFGKFRGGIVRETEKSKEIFERLIDSQGVQFPAK